MHRNGRITAQGYALRPEGFARLAAFLGLRSDPAKVVALSAGGISLLVRHPLRGERAITLELANRARSYSRLQPIRILRVQPADGGYLVDGRFTAPVPQEELEALLS
jgi:hypothetical protein